MVLFASTDQTLNHIPAIYLFFYKVHYRFKIQIVQEIKNNKTITQKISIIRTTIQY